MGMPTLDPDQPRTSARGGESFERRGENRWHSRTGTTERQVEDGAAPVTEPKTDMWAWMQSSQAQRVERPDGAIRVRSTRQENGRPSEPVPPIHAVQFATVRTACGRHCPRYIWTEWPPDERADACTKCHRALRSKRSAGDDFESPSQPLGHAFPSALRPAAEQVVASLPPAEHRPAGSFSVLVNGEIVTIPYRLYHPVRRKDPVPRASDQEELILECMLTRHHDGHVRQRALERVLDGTDDWIVPFVVR